MKHVVIIKACLNLRDVSLFPKLISVKYIIRLASIKELINLIYSCVCALIPQAGLYDLITKIGWLSSIII